MLFRLFFRRVLVLRIDHVAFVLLVVGALFARLAVAEGASGGRAIEIRAPLMAMSKAEIIRTGLALGVDYAATVSCYAPSAGGLACGVCDSCALRLRAFAEVGTPDPASYSAPSGV